MSPKVVRGLSLGLRCDERAVTVVHGDADAPVFITCEHASCALPAPYQWPDADRRLVGTHWSYDLGAREISLELAQALGASAVLSEFSRLLVDANREEGHPDLFRNEAEGELVQLNQGLSAEERERRVRTFHRAYHDAVDSALAVSRAQLLLSVHSFTPSYMGVPRAMDVGVLFDKYEAEALQLGAALSAEMPRVVYNEPWSGRAGLIYSAESHAERFGKIALEIEVRQDLAVDPVYRAKLVAALASHIAATYGTTLQSGTG